MRRSRPGSADREHQIVPHPRRTPSPLRPGLSFRYTQPRFLALAVAADVGAIPDDDVRTECGRHAANDVAVRRLARIPDSLGQHGVKLRLAEFLRLLRP